MENLAERIVEYRAVNKLNQQEFADKVGVSKQTIYSIENGLQEPSKVTRAKIELVIRKEE